MIILLVVTYKSLVAFFTYFIFIFLRILKGDKYFIDHKNMVFKVLELKKNEKVKKYHTSSEEKISYINYANC